MIKVLNYPNRVTRRKHWLIINQSGRMSHCSELRLKCSCSIYCVVYFRLIEYAPFKWTNLHKIRYFSLRCIKIMWIKINSQHLHKFCFLRIWEYFMLQLINYALWDFSLSDIHSQGQQWTMKVQFPPAGKNFNTLCKWMWIWNAICLFLCVCLSFDVKNRNQ